MPVITVKFKDRVIREHSIIIGQNCCIGRKSGNDIVIDNLAVSGFHAQIDPVSTNFVLRDLKSTNGTFVNNKKVTLHNLKHRDIILIGKHELHYDCSDILRMKSNEPSPFDDEKTHVLDTRDFRKLMGKKPKRRKRRSGSEHETVVLTENKKPSLITRLLSKLFG